MCSRSEISHSGRRRYGVLRAGGALNLEALNKLILRVVVPLLLDMLAVNVLETLRRQKPKSSLVVVLIISDHTKSVPWSQKNILFSHRSAVYLPMSPWRLRDIRIKAPGRGVEWLGVGVALIPDFDSMPSLSSAVVSTPL